MPNNNSLPIRLDTVPILPISGLDAAKFTMEKHYEIAVNDVANGALFKAANENDFHELAKYFSNADLIVLIAL